MQSYPEHPRFRGMPSDSPARHILFSAVFERMYGFNHLLGYPRPTVDILDQITEFCHLPLFQDKAQISAHGDLILVGQPSMHNEVLQIIQPEHEHVKGVVSAVYGKARRPDPICVVLGDDRLFHAYRFIGEGTVLALNGTSSIFINTTQIAEFGGFESPRVKINVKHEIRHQSYALSLPLAFISTSQLPAYTTDLDTICHEALGGPSETEAWKHIQIDPRVQMDAIEIEGFWPWHVSQTQRLGYSQVSFFESPVTRAFYTWAYEQGDEAYWVKQALIKAAPYIHHDLLSAGLEILAAGASENI